jgi:hypothetical protein
MTVGTEPFWKTKGPLHQCSLSPSGYVVMPLYILSRTHQTGPNLPGNDTRQGCGFGVAPWNLCLPPTGFGAGMGVVASPGVG